MAAGGGGPASGGGAAGVRLREGGAEAGEMRPPQAQRLAPGAQQPPQQPHAYQPHGGHGPGWRGPPPAGASGGAAAGAGAAALGAGAEQPRQAALPFGTSHGAVRAAAAPDGSDGGPGCGSWSYAAAAAAGSGGSGGASSGSGGLPPATVGMAEQLRQLVRARLPPCPGAAPAVRLPRTWPRCPCCPCLAATRTRPSAPRPDLLAPGPSQVVVSDMECGGGSLGTAQLAQQQQQQRAQADQLQAYQAQQAHACGQQAQQAGEAMQGLGGSSGSGGSGSAADGWPRREAGGRLGGRMAAAGGIAGNGNESLSEKGCQSDL